MLCLLFLLQLLLLLVVFLFDLLQLLLLTLLDLLLLLFELLLPSRIGVLLLDFLLLLLLLLNLLLLDLLVFLILLLLELLNLLLVLLFQTRIDSRSRPRIGRAVVVCVWIGVGVYVGIRVHIRIGIYVGVGRPVVVCRGVHVGVGVVVYRRVDVRIGVCVGVHVCVSGPIIIRRCVHVRIDVGGRRAIVVRLHATVARLDVTLLSVPLLHVSPRRICHDSRGRRDAHWHYVVMGLLSLHLACLRVRNGPPFIGLDGFLTLCERQRSGRRRRLGDDCTGLDSSGWLIARNGATTQDRLLRRHNGGRCDGNLCGGHLALINADDVACDRLSGAEGLTGCCGDAASNALIYVGYVGDVLVDDGSVVVVVDHRLVHRSV